MLSLEAVSAGYRRLQILHDVNLEVGEGEVVSLIGANGAGKTTTLRTICGLLPTGSGTITFRNKKITGLRPDQIVRAGLVHVPQGRALFGALTVHENLIMGRYNNRSGSYKDSLRQVFDLFPVLEERHDQRAGTLSGGQQQMLAIARALMAGPQLLTLDEPSVGLAPNLVADVFDAVQRIRESGITVLMVEQNAAQTLQMSDRAYVMESGHIAFEGVGTALINDPRVRTAYLGM